MTVKSDSLVAGTADSNPDREVRPEFMAGMYAWTSAGVIVVAFTARFLGGFPRLVTTISHHRALSESVLLVQFFLAAGVSASALDFEPAVAAGVFMAACVNAGIAVTLLMPNFATSFFAPLLMAAGAYALLAAFVAAARRHLDDLGPSLFIAMAGMLLSFLVGVGWRSDYPAFLGMSVVTLAVAILTAFSSAYLRLNMAARSPDKPPVATTGAALAFCFGCVTYFMAVIPSSLKAGRLNRPDR